MAGAAKFPPDQLAGFDVNGPWFYNALSGELAYETGLAALAYKLAAHAPLDWYGFKTRADVLAAITKEGWPAPTSSFGKNLENVAGQAAGGVAHAAGSALGSALGLPGFQNTRGLATRVVKVGLGAIAIIAGFSMITHASQALSNVKVLPI